jgi:hypothetical protein
LWQTGQLINVLINDLGTVRLHSAGLYNYHHTIRTSVLHMLTSPSSLQQIQAVFSSSEKGEKYIVACFGFIW